MNENKNTNCTVVEEKDETDDYVIDQTDEEQINQSAYDDNNDFNDNYYDEVEDLEDDKIEKKSKRTKKTFFGYGVKTTPNYKKCDSDFIKKLRRKLNLSEKNFGDVLGVLPETILAWESGQKMPKTTTLRLLFLLWVHPELANELFTIEKIANVNE